MKIGAHIPPWRTPTFLNGKLSFSSLRDFGGQYLVLCCSQSLTTSQALLFESQSEDFQNSHVRLATLLTHNIKQESLWPLPRLNTHVPLLTDPLRRLSRSLGLTQHRSAKRCETLIFNRDGRLEFRLIHDINQRGLMSVLEVTERLVAQHGHTNLLHETLVGSGT